LGWELGEALYAPLGRFGSLFVLGALFVLLSLGTLGWNPLRAPFLWGVRRLRLALEDFLAFRSERRERQRLEHEAWVAEEARLKAEADAEAEFAAASTPEADPGLQPFAFVEGEFPSKPAVAEEEPKPSPLAIFGGGSGKKKGKKAATPSLFAPEDPADLLGGELPPLTLLSLSEPKNRQGMDRDLDELGHTLVQKLRTFSVESEIGGRTTGPVVTQFEVIPAPGVKVNRIANLEADLALAMRAKTIRIVAPIPGKGAVGVEIPNPYPEKVLIRDILESQDFRNSRVERPLALGKDLHGEPYVADLAKMPHALIAGATGAGKSVCLNTIITSLVYRHTPETLRLLMIDPKMVELSTYSDLPHLRHSVVTDPRDAAGILSWAVIEMERRYNLLKENGVRSIGEFNRRLRDGKTMRRAVANGDEGDPDRWIYQEGVLPFVVLVIDELADLMMSVQSEVEKPLTLLAQKARAIGIHLIVATQRPSVNVITGLIKANFPCRIAFRVASKTDSRTILDQNGADALLGNGDMLFLPPGQNEPVRWR
jgi:S-DNA-T family DNA segregation ATPase FtsK/SpoIIIE